MTQLNSKFLADFSTKYGVTSKALARLIRPTFIASPERKLVWGDWVSIEARVLPWLARAEEPLDIFRANDKDPSLPDNYLIEAGNIFDCDPMDIMERRESKDVDIKKEADEQRQTGKVSVLALGFGGAVGSLMAMATGYGIYLSEEQAIMIVGKWRERNPWAKRFWDQLKAAVQECREAPGREVHVGRLIYMFDDSYLGGTLFCIMPCGRPLSYPGLRMEKFVDVDPDTKAETTEWKLTYSSGFMRKKMWHGVLCLAGDSLVATDRGWVQLIDVKKTDRLWDGVEWVNHDGLIYQGTKSTVPVDGVRMTRDHEVLTTGGWVEAQDTEGLDRAEVWLPYGFGLGTDDRSPEDGAVAGAVQLRYREAGKFGGVEQGKPPTVSHIMRVRDEIAHSESPHNARYDATPGVRGVAVDARPLHAADASVVAQLRRAWHYGLSGMDEFVRGVLGRHGADVQVWVNSRPQGQRAGVLERELPLGYPQGAEQQHAPQPAVQRAGAVSTDRRSGKHSLLPLAQEPVYDLVNAGPRARFVVLGHEGPFIVHNCENPTQGFAASLLRHTLREVDDLTDDYLVGHTHDEVITEVPEDDVEEWARDLKRIMETNKDWNEGLPLVAEITSAYYYTKAVKGMKL